VYDSHSGDLFLALSVGVNDVNSAARLLYVGDYVGSVDAIALKRALGAAQVSNRRGDVTGVYCYSETSFIEVLEGAPQEVEAAVERCLRNGISRQLRLIQRDTVAHRQFDGWLAMPIARAELSDLVEMCLCAPALEAKQIERMVTLLCLDTEFDSRY